MTSTNYRYQLQPYKNPSSRYNCPQCNGHKTFTRYIDTVTNCQLAPMVGRCGREHNCGYHYTPKQYFANHPEAGTVTKEIPIDISQKYLNLKPSTIATSEVLRSIGNYKYNNLVLWLDELFGHDRVLPLLHEYRIGTNDHWPGATVFWQIDEQGKARTGKIMLYHPDTGKRLKKAHSYIYWMHRKLYAGYYLKQCLFGQHLLPKYPDKPIAIVESEKTALLAALHLPQYLWLATGGIHNLNAVLCQVLKGRKVILYPDVNAYALWQQKANNLALLIPNTTFKVDAYLELNATGHQRLESWDLGDWLVG